MVRMHRPGRTRMVVAAFAVMATGLMLQTAFGPIASARTDLTDQLEVEVSQDGDRASIKASLTQATTTDGSPGGRGTEAAAGAAAPKGRASRASKDPSGATGPVEPPLICTNEVGGLDFALATPPPPEMDDPYLVNFVCTRNGLVTAEGSVVEWRDRTAEAAAAAAGAPPPAAAPAITEVDIRRYVEDFLIPELVIRHNPEGYSLTGVETWFWVEGWDGAPVIETVDVLGFPVLVELRLATVEWEFGDGTSAQTTDLGRAYPDKTGTTHVYTDRSTVGGDEAAFTATSTVTIEVEVSIGGSPLVALQPFSRTQTVPIVVREAQALLE